MQDIIKPIDRALLKAELTGDKKLRRTNKSNNEIYIITAHDSPNVMQEIGRLREIAFRYYGGGTGFPVDIDEYDTMDDAYRQLIVWSPLRFGCKIRQSRQTCFSNFPPFQFLR